MIAAALSLIVHTLIVIAGGCILAAGIIRLDREIARGLARRRD